MKETYETIEMEIHEISADDVITVSGFDIETFSVHDNGYIDFSAF